MNANQIRDRILNAYSDAEVEVIDQTGTQDHWEIHLRTDRLKGLSRINQQRAIMQIFDPELKTGEMHAITIKIHSKGEL